MRDSTKSFPTASGGAPGSISPNVDHKVWTPNVGERQLSLLCPWLLSSLFVITLTLEAASVGAQRNAPNQQEKTVPLACLPQFTGIDTIGSGILSGPPLVLVDLDADGDLDAITRSSAGSADEGITWWQNNGSGEFTRIMLIEQVLPHTVAVADLDRDGDLDIVCMRGSTPGLLWFENEAQLAFSQHVVDSSAFGSLHYGAGMDTADLDGDSLPDIIVPGPGATGAFSWYENSGNESFTKHSLPYSGWEAWMITAADLDGDGDLDLVAAADSNAQIPWWENDGSGEFTLREVGGFVPGVLWLTVKDLDFDSDNDIVAVAGGSAGIHWWENDGAGQFQLHTIVENELIATFISVVDVDGDGDLDLMTGGVIDWAWWENNGDFAFTSHPLPGASPYQGATLASGDVDNDLSQDILGTSWSGSGFFLWRNECPAPQCDCPAPSDLDSSSALDALDLAIVIDIVFFGGIDVQDPGCPVTRSDFNHNAVTDAIDLALLIDHVFFGGLPPQNPCSLF